MEAAGDSVLVCDEHTKDVGSIIQKDLVQAEERERELSRLDDAVVEADGATHNFLEAGRRYKEKKKKENNRFLVAMAVVVCIFVVAVLGLFFVDILI
ncbi:MAG: uncharacterized protein A8A55_1662 [Amphiamblys sp. WSBS2006]|nr:MAG: uncharacterized protein A8A55_1662 [Amphiamblys sp. WSBS2006]